MILFYFFFLLSLYSNFKIQYNHFDIFAVVDFKDNLYQLQYNKLIRMKQYSLPRLTDYQQQRIESLEDSFKSACLIAGQSLSYCQLFLRSVSQQRFQSKGEELRVKTHILSDEMSLLKKKASFCQNMSVLLAEREEIIRILRSQLIINRKLKELNLRSCCEKLVGIRLYSLSILQNLQNLVIRLRVARSEYVSEILQKLVQDTDFLRFTGLRKHIKFSNADDPLFLVPLRNFQNLQLVSDYNKRSIINLFTLTEAYQLRLYNADRFLRRVDNQQPQEFKSFELKPAKAAQLDYDQEAREGRLIRSSKIIPKFLFPELPAKKHGLKLKEHSNDGISSMIRSLINDSQTLQRPHNIKSKNEFEAPKRRAVTQTDEYHHLSSSTGHDDWSLSHNHRPKPFQSHNTPEDLRKIQRPQYEQLANSRPKKQQQAGHDQTQQALRSPNDSRKGRAPQTKSRRSTTNIKTSQSLSHYQQPHLRAIERKGNQRSLPRGDGREWTWGRHQSVSRIKEKRRRKSIIKIIVEDGSKQTIIQEEMTCKEQLGDQNSNKKCFSNHRNDRNLDFSPEVQQKIARIQRMSSLPQQQIANQQQLESEIINLSSSQKHQGVRYRNPVDQIKHIMKNNKKQRTKNVHPNTAQNEKQQISAVQQFSIQLGELKGQANKNRAQVDQKNIESHQNTRNNTTLIIEDRNGSINHSSSKQPNQVNASFYHHNLSNLPVTNAPTASVQYKSHNLIVKIPSNQTLATQFPQKQAKQPNLNNPDDTRIKSIQNRSINNQNREVQTESKVPAQSGLKRHIENVSQLQLPSNQKLVIPPKKQTTIATPIRDYQPLPAQTAGLNRGQSKYVAANKEISFESLDKKETKNAQNLRVSEYLSSNNRVARVQPQRKQLQIKASERGEQGSSMVRRAQMVQKCVFVSKSMEQSVLLGEIKSFNGQSLRQVEPYLTGSYFKNRHVMMTSCMFRDETAGYCLHYPYLTKHSRFVFILHLEISHKYATIQGQLVNTFFKYIFSSDPTHKIIYLKHKILLRPQFCAALQGQSFYGGEVNAPIKGREMGEKCLLFERPELKCSKELEFSDVISCYFIYITVATDLSLSNQKFRNAFFSSNFLKRVHTALKKEQAKRFLNYSQISAYLDEERLPEFTRCRRDSELLLYSQFFEDCLVNVRYFVYAKYFYFTVEPPYSYLHETKDVYYLLLSTSVENRYFILADKIYEETEQLDLYQHFRANVLSKKMGQVFGESKRGTVVACPQFKKTIELQLSSSATGMLSFGLNWKEYIKGVRFLPEDDVQIELVGPFFCSLVEIDQNNAIQQMFSALIEERDLIK